MGAIDAQVETKKGRCAAATKEATSLGPKAGRWPAIQVVPCENGPT